MKIFKQRELREAHSYAVNGETAIHLHFMVFPNSPACFKKDIALGLPIAHVFSLDKEYLIELAKNLGVKRIVIDRSDTPSQHIDLCGSPLKRLMIEVGSDIEDYRRETECQH